MQTTREFTGKDPTGTKVKIHSTRTWSIKPGRILDLESRTLDVHPRASIVLRSHAAAIKKVHDDPSFLSHLEQVLRNMHGEKQSTHIVGFLSMAFLGVWKHWIRESRTILATTLEMKIPEMETAMRVSFSSLSLPSQIVTTVFSAIHRMIGLELNVTLGTYYLAWRSITDDPMSGLMEQRVIGMERAVDMLKIPGSGALLSVWKNHGLSLIKSLKQRHQHVDDSLIEFCESFKPIDLIPDATGDNILTVLRQCKIHMIPLETVQGMFKAVQMSGSESGKGTYLDGEFQLIGGCISHMMIHSHESSKQRIEIASVNVFQLVGSELKWSEYKRFAV